MSGCQWGTGILRESSRDKDKGEMRGFFPFAALKGQNDETWWLYSGVTGAFHLQLISTTRISSAEVSHVSLPTTLFDRVAADRPA